MVSVPERVRERDSEIVVEWDSSTDSWTVMAGNLQRVQHLPLCRRVKPNKIYAPVASNAKDISDKDGKMRKSETGRQGVRERRAGAVWKRELFQFRRQTTICAQNWRQFSPLAAFWVSAWACWPTRWNFHL